MYYLVLFTIPSITIIDCSEGFIFVNYIALGIIMFTIFSFDVVNIWQFI
jgi:hypothetical protein